MTSNGVARVFLSNASAITTRANNRGYGSLVLGGLRAHTAVIIQHCVQ
jgi:hypothetical protein